MAKTLCMPLLILFGLLPLLIPAAGYPDTLKVAFAHWPPRKIIEDNQVDGVDARILKRLGKRLGVTMDFSVCPWARCVYLFKQGKVDLITSFSKNEERLTFTEYLGSPYATDKISFWVKNSSPFVIERYADLYGKKVGLIRGAVYFKAFDEEKGFTRVEVNSEDQMFRMLESGRIDTFIGYRQVVEYLLIKYGYAGRFTQCSFQINGHGSYIAMSLQSPNRHWQSSLETELQTMIDNGEVEEIIEQFMRDVKPLHHNPPELKQN